MCVSYPASSLLLLLNLDSLLFSMPCSGLTFPYLQDKSGTTTKYHKPSLTPNETKPSVRGKFCLWEYFVSPTPNTFFFLHSLWFELNPDALMNSVYGRLFSLPCALDHQCSPSCRCFININSKPLPSYLTRGRADVSGLQIGAAIEFLFLLFS